MSDTGVPIYDPRARRLLAIDAFDRGWRGGIEVHSRLRGRAAVFHRGRGASRPEGWRGVGYVETADLYRSLGRLLCGIGEERLIRGPEPDFEFRPDPGQPWSDLLRACWRRGEGDRFSLGYRLLALTDDELSETCRSQGGLFAEPVRALLGALDRRGQLATLRDAAGPLGTAESYERALALLSDWRADAAWRAEDRRRALVERDEEEMALAGDLDALFARFGDAIPPLYLSLVRRFAPPEIGPRFERLLLSWWRCPDRWPDDFDGNRRPVRQDDIFLRWLFDGREAAAMAYLAVSGNPDLAQLLEWLADGARDARARLERGECPVSSMASAIRRGLMKFRARLAPPGEDE